MRARDELLFAWPSFSIYPHLAALSGAREIRVPLAAGYAHDLDAMLAEVTAATQLICVCNPNNPTGTPPPGRDRREFCERLPDHVTVALDEAYVEFQPDDDPDATVDLLARVPNLRRAATFSKVSRPGGPSVRLRALLARLPGGARRGPPAVQRQRLAQVAAAEAVMQRRRRRPTGRAHDRRAGVRRGGSSASSASSNPASQANFSWVSLGDCDEDALSPRSLSAVSSSGREWPRRPRPHPRHATGPEPRTSASWPRSARRSPAEPAVALRQTACTICAMPARYKLRR